MIMNMQIIRLLALFMASAFLLLHDRPIFSQESPDPNSNQPGQSKGKAAEKKNGTNPWLTEVERLQKLLAETAEKQAERSRKHEADKLAVQQCALKLGSAPQKERKGLEELLEKSRSAADSSFLNYIKSKEQYNKTSLDLRSIKIACSLFDDIERLRKMLEKETSEIEKTEKSIKDIREKIVISKIYLLLIKETINDAADGKNPLFVVSKDDMEKTSNDLKNLVSRLDMHSTKLISEYISISDIESSLTYNIQKYDAIKKIIDDNAKRKSEAEK